MADFYRPQGAYICSPADVNYKCDGRGCVPVHSCLGGCPTLPVCPALDTCPTAKVCPSVKSEGQIQTTGIRAVPAPITGAGVGYVLIAVVAGLWLHRWRAK